MSTVKLVLAGQAYQLFIDSCTSPKTKQTYEASLRSYMLFRKVSSVEPLLTEDIDQVQVVRLLPFLSTSSALLHL
jgi:hypothetical protein